MDILNNKKIYFLSDFHLGAPDAEKSLLREKKIVDFLESIRSDAQEIFILGDIFDFWYEYKYVVPKGFVRLLGKLAQLSDEGIKIRVFIGNHDMWMKDYFAKELNIDVFYDPAAFQYNQKKFYIGHGDGLGPGDYGYKFIKKVFRNPLCRWFFGWIHPSIGISIANYFSKKSRVKTGNTDEEFLGEENEWLVIYCKEVLQKEFYDYFVFGHRHYAMNIQLPQNSRYINLGDWIKNFTYAVFDGNDMQLKKWEK